MSRQTPRRSRDKVPKGPKIRPGMDVANGHGKLDVDPFVRLVVVAVHKDGTLDITTAGGEFRWNHVPASDVDVVAP